MPIKAMKLIVFSSIQLWLVYLNVYQLLDLIPRSSPARITNAWRLIHNKMILEKSVHTVHLWFLCINFNLLGSE